MRRLVCRKDAHDRSSMHDKRQRIPRLACPGDAQKRRRTARTERGGILSVRERQRTAAFHPFQIRSIRFQLRVIFALIPPEIAFPKVRNGDRSFVGIQNRRRLKATPHRRTINKIRPRIGTGSQKRFAFLAKRLVRAADIASFQISRRHAVTNEINGHLIRSPIPQNTR